MSWNKELCLKLIAYCPKAEIPALREALADVIIWHRENGDNIAGCLTGKYFEYTFQDMQAMG